MNKNEHIDCKSLKLANRIRIGKGEDAEPKDPSRMSCGRGVIVACSPLFAFRFSIFAIVLAVAHNKQLKAGGGGGEAWQTEDEDESFCRHNVCGFYVLRASYNIFAVPT